MGQTWMGKTVCIWGTGCQMDSLSPRLQGKRKSALWALRRQSSTGYKAPGGIPGAGSPLASTETVPSITSPDFSFCGKSHLLSKEGDISLHWPSQYTLGSLISVLCCSWQHIHFFDFPAMTLALHEFGGAPCFLTSVSSLIVFKISCCVFFFLGAHHLSLPLALLIPIMHSTCCTP